MWSEGDQEHASKRGRHAKSSNCFRELFLASVQFLLAKVKIMMWLFAVDVFSLIKC